MLRMFAATVFVAATRTLEAILWIHCEEATERFPSDAFEAITDVRREMASRLIPPVAGDNAGF